MKVKRLYQIFFCLYMSSLHQWHNVNIMLNPTDIRQNANLELYFSLELNCKWHKTSFEIFDFKVNIYIKYIYTFMITFFHKKWRFRAKITFSIMCILSQRNSRIDINIRNLCYNEMHNIQIYAWKCVDFN